MNDNNYFMYGSTISFNKKFNQPLEPYYQIINRMIFLELGHYFNQIFVLMPNIKILHVGDQFVQKLTLGKNIMCLTCSYQVFDIFPKNMILFKICWNGSNVKANAKMNKNMKYMFVDCQYKPVAILNKNMVHYENFDQFPGFDMINKKMLHLRLKIFRKCVELPKKLASLLVDIVFKPIVLTPYIKHLIVSSKFKQHMILEYPVKILKIYNQRVDNRIIDNIPNNKEKHAITLIVDGTRFVRNMPNDVGNENLGKDVLSLKGNPVVVVEYGPNDKFSKTRNATCYINEIYSCLVQDIK